MITLGNAALRVVRDMLGHLGLAPPETLPPSFEMYGTPIRASLGGDISFNVVPLAHPASPDKYQRAHDRWIEANNMHGIDSLY